MEQLINTVIQFISENIAITILIISVIPLLWIALRDDLAKKGTSTRADDKALAEALYHTLLNDGCQHCGNDLRITNAESKEETISLECNNKSCKRQYLINPGLHYAKRLN